MKNSEVVSDTVMVNNIRVQATLRQLNFEMVADTKLWPNHNGSERVHPTVSAKRRNLATMKEDETTHSRQRDREPQRSIPRTGEAARTRNPVQMDNTAHVYLLTYSDLH